MSGLENEAIQWFVQHSDNVKCTGKALTPVDGYKAGVLAEQARTHGREFEAELRLRTLKSCAVADPGERCIRLSQLSLMRSQPGKQLWNWLTE